MMLHFGGGGGVSLTVFTITTDACLLNYTPVNNKGEPSFDVHERKNAPSARKNREYIAVIHFFHYFLQLRSTIYLSIPGQGTTLRPTERQKGPVGNFLLRWWWW